MQIIAENSQLEKDGVRYLIRGPDIDWGVMQLAPKQKKPAHYHEQLAESFYVMQGTITFIVKGIEKEIPAGTAVRIDALEPHAFWNKSTTDPAKMVFIKEKYLPKDKIDVP